MPDWAADRHGKSEIKETEKVFIVFLSYEGVKVYTYTQKIFQKITLTKFSLVTIFHFYDGLEIQKIEHLFIFF